MPSIATIPPELPFLDTLAQGLLAGGAERLGHTLLLLPSRRACLMARDAFLRAADGQPLLLPQLRPVGEPDADELVLDPASALALPPAVGQIERRLLLTRLIVAKRDPLGGHAMPHEQAVRLAGELASLLDELATEEVTLANLELLVPEDLAEHWQLTLDFLRILERQWPALLASRDVLDPAERRVRLLAALARRWAKQPPRHPVVAAGVTGSIPAVARLLATVARLPDGLVLLPGLDRGIEPADWRALGPSHPQWALRRVLDALELAPAEVPSWPRPDVRPAPRSALWREVMRPAARPPAPLPADAFAGVTVAHHPDPAAEALDLALRIREALATPGRTVMLVTPDRGLARRVAVELARWEIAATDSAGVPLDQTPPGSFLLLAAHLLSAAAGPAELLSLLKHPLAAGRLPEGEFRRRARALERLALRGPRPAPGLEGVLAVLRAPAQRASDPLAGRRAELAAWLASLADGMRPFAAAVAEGQGEFAALLDAHLAWAADLAADVAGSAAALWAREAGLALERFVAELRDAAPVLGRVPVDAYPALLAVLMAGTTVRPGRPGHPRVQILGRLESRLATADLVLLAGFAEGVWPQAVEGGPWLNRAMRERLGLPPVEQAVGIAAHDLVLAAAAPELVLSRAQKDTGGTPTTPSRWLSRLVAVARRTPGAAEAIAPAPHFAPWRLQLDAPRVPRWPLAAARPQPTPPLSARPREFTATDLQDLMTDPWRLYARRILRLRELDPLDADPGPAERGQLVHQAIQRFLEAHPAGALPADALARLLEVGRGLFQARAHEPQIVAVWWPRFVSLAEWLVEAEGRRREGLQQLWAELEGFVELAAPGGPVRLRARADRVERTATGGIRLVDYKTGRMPDNIEVRTGLAPQLALEALIASAGGFPGVGAGEVETVHLWALRGGEEGGKEHDPTLDRRQPATTAARLAAEARTGLERLLAHFDRPDTAYAPVPLPAVARRGDGYEHLARLAEWYAAEPEA